MKKVLASMTVALTVILAMSSCSNSLTTPSELPDQSIYMTSKGDNKRAHQFALVTEKGDIPFKDCERVTRWPNEYKCVSADEDLTLTYRARKGWSFTKVEVKQSGKRVDYSCHRQNFSDEMKAYCVPKD